MSVAGFGFTEDQSDRVGYKKYDRSEFISSISYNLNQSLSIDSKFILNKRDVDRYSYAYESIDKIILVGASYFQNNNIFFSFLIGNNEDSYKEYNYEYEDTDFGWCGALGYRLKLSSAVSFDIGYYIYAWDNNSDPVNQLEFLIRMFL